MPLDSGWTAAARTLEVSRNDPGSEMRVRTISFFVDGVDCRRCAREVTSRLRDVASEIAFSQVAPAVPNQDHREPPLRSC